MEEVIDNIAKSLGISKELVASYLKQNNIDEKSLIKPDYNKLVEDYKQSRAEELKGLSPGDMANKLKQIDSDASIHANNQLSSYNTNIGNITTGISKSSDASSLRKADKVQTGLEAVRDVSKYFRNRKDIKRAQKELSSLPEYRDSINLPEQPNPALLNEMATRAFGVGANTNEISRNILNERNRLGSFDSAGGGQQSQVGLANLKRNQSQKDLLAAQIADANARQSAMTPLLQALQLEGQNADRRIGVDSLNQRTFNDILSDKKGFLSSEKAQAEANNYNLIEGGLLSPARIAQEVYKRSMNKNSYNRMKYSSPPNPYKPYWGWGNEDPVKPTFSF